MSDLQINLTDLPVMLPFISSFDRDQWLNVGMGLKSEFGDDAYSYWDDWSSTAGKDGGYSSKTCMTTWKSFTKSGIGIGSVIKLASDNGWKPEKQELTKEERKRQKEEAEARRKAVAEKAEKDERKQIVMNDKVSVACNFLWTRHVVAEGESLYLQTKQVKPYGVGFLVRKIALVVDFGERENAYILVGQDIKAFLDGLPKPRPDTVSYLIMDKGGLLIPLRDHEGKLWSVQYINHKGTKLFPKFTKKSGCFHVLGAIDEASEVVLLAEGYATAATLFEAVGYPVVVTFDSGNLYNVGKSFHARYPHVLKAFMGDDDRFNQENTGRKKAEDAAQECNGVAIFPDFSGCALSG